MNTEVALREMTDRLGSPEAAVRAGAVSVFCRTLMEAGEILVPGRALQLFGRVIESDGSAEVRRAAADALCWTFEWTGTGAPYETVRSLCSVLQDRDKSEIHALVARALGFAGVKKGHRLRTSALKSAAQDGPDDEIRAEALVALGRLKLASQRRIIVDALDDESGKVRNASAVALGLLGERRGVEGPLIARLADEPDGEIKASILRSLTLIGSKKVRATLIKILDAGKPSGENDSLRVEALRALPLLYHEKFKERLILALTDESDALREAALLLMIEQRGDLALDGFAAELKSRTLREDCGPEKPLLLWALHRWRCACEGRGSMIGYSRRFDDFLEEYAEQSLMAAVKELGKNRD